MVLIREFEYKVLEAVVQNPGLNVSRISQTVRGTFTHIHKLVNELEQHGLLRSERPKRRIRQVYPTEKGRKVYEYLSKAYALLKQ